MMAQPKRDRKVPAPTATKILVADDEEMIRDLLSRVLSQEGYQVTCAADGQEAVKLMRKERYDLVIADLVMPRVNGVELLRKAKEIDPTCPVIVITGYPSVDTVTQLVRLGAVDYVTKPFNVDLIRVTVAKHLEMSRVQTQDRAP